MASHHIKTSRGQHGTSKTVQSNSSTATQENARFPRLIPVSTGNAVGPQNTAKTTNGGFAKHDSLDRARVIVKTHKGFKTTMARFENRESALAIW